MVSLLELASVKTEAIHLVGNLRSALIAGVIAFVAYTVISVATGTGLGPPSASG